MKPILVAVRALAACALYSLLAPFSVSAAAADVLDAPAAASALAPRALVNGLAQAGSRIVAVGQRGHILYSDNQGQQWTQACSFAGLQNTKA